MARARGRGAVAGLGFVLLFAGLVGGAVLWILAIREPERAAEGFARAAPGCRTTLSFSETGEFYVYEELSGLVAAEGCEPETSPDQSFTWELFGPDGEPVAAVDDTGVSYELDVGSARSVARVDISSAGVYEIEVRGSDPAVVAAIGRDPEENVMRLRASAIAAAVIGLALGAVMLWTSGRRSRRAAAVTAPADPGWGVTERDRARRTVASSAAEDEWAERLAGRTPATAPGPLIVPDGETVSGSEPVPGGETVPDPADHQWPPSTPSLDGLDAQPADEAGPGSSPWAPPSAETIRRAGGEDDVPPPPS